jgi:excinuclease ABC subunit B
VKARRDDPLLPSMEELRADRSGSSTASPLRGRDERSSLSGSIAASDRGAGMSKVHKPHLDEMHGPESLPHRTDRTLPAKPFGSASRIIQPTDSKQSGPEFGPAPRSTGGAPGHRGGWKKR